MKQMFKSIYMGFQSSSFRLDRFRSGRSQSNLALALGLAVGVTMALGAGGSVWAAQTMHLEQVLQKVIDHYPSLKTAAIQVERARQENQKVESQLGWQLGGQAGINRDMSSFGVSTSDNLNLSGSLNRSLSSGDQVGMSASVNRSDAEFTFSPSLPNPNTTTNLELNYRMPLAKGDDNPDYTQGLVQAQAGVSLADAEHLSLYDQLASQVIELYLSAAVTRAQLENIEQTIGRTRRLQKFIKERFDLGVSEEHDLLQVNAQLRTSQAEHSGLQMVWQKQQVSLNRLMGLDWSSQLNPVFITTSDHQGIEFQKLLDQVNQHSPDLQGIKARIQQANSAIEIARDAREDQLDLVMFVGNKSSSGDAIIGDISESDLVGGINLEFNRGLDKSGFDAALYQAQLDRSAALQDQLQVMEDLQYGLSSLLAEINAGEAALKAYTLSVKSEQAKLDEAVLRYKAGRTDTDQLITFESALSGAQLAQQLQRIELARRYRDLSLLRGTLWQSIRFTEYTYEIGE